MLFNPNRRKLTLGSSSVRAIVLLLQAASAAPAEDSTSTGGRIIEFRGTRRDERVVTTGVSPALQVQPEYRAGTSLPLGGLTSPHFFPTTSTDENNRATWLPINPLRLDAEVSEDLARLPGGERLPNEQVADLSGTNAANSSASTAPSGLLSQAVTSDKTWQQPAVIQQHGAASDRYIGQVLMAICIVFATSLVGLLLLLVVLRRLSWHQNSTIRIVLADSDSATLRALANRLALAGNEDAGGRECSALSSASGLLSLPKRQTTVVELANSSFAAALMGPTFAESNQAEEKRRLEQEGAILRSVYDHNLQLVEGLGKGRAAASSAKQNETRIRRIEPTGTHKHK
jgi:hypothetical protein